VRNESIAGSRVLSILAEIQVQELLERVCTRQNFTRDTDGLMFEHPLPHSNSACVGVMYLVWLYLMTNTWAANSLSWGVDLVRAAAFGCVAVLLRIFFPRPP
jgi:hypothetical protein